MATVRITLLTFRRPRLLPRALDSLRRQTFPDWVCEVRNDDPTDPFPAELVAAQRDPRLRLVAGEARGATAAFNAVYRAGPEPFQSLLEDDNWWEPLFLEKMVEALGRHPEAEMAWSNMRIWVEQADGGWRDTGRGIWTEPAAAGPRLFRWPQLLQFSDSLHSNGAMLLRARAADRLILPEGIPLDWIEVARERCMGYPILFLPEVLAHYALTRQTARAGPLRRWAGVQALLGASFLAEVPLTPRARQALWQQRRASRPRATNELIFAGLVGGEAAFLRSAQPADWLFFVLGCVRHPLAAWAVLRSRRAWPELWAFLREATAARTAEARRDGFSVLDLPALVAKDAEPMDRPPS